MQYCCSIVAVLLQYCRQLNHIKPTNIKTNYTWLALPKRSTVTARKGQGNIPWQRRVTLTASPTVFWIFSFAFFCGFFGMGPVPWRFLRTGPANKWANSLRMLTITPRLHINAGCNHSTAQIRAAKRALRKCVPSKVHGIGKLFRFAKPLLISRDHVFAGWGNISKKGQYITGLMCMGKLELGELS